MSKPDLKAIADKLRGDTARASFIDDPGLTPPMFAVGDSGRVVELKPGTLEPIDEPMPFELESETRVAEASLSHAGADGWVGWVLRSTTRGYEWARVTISAELLPFVVHGTVKPGDVRAGVAAYIERDVLSDKLSDPTRWRP